MTLAPMRFKDYVWPHNPRTYEIEYKREIISHKVPFGNYVLQTMGRTNRVLRGEGEFAGRGAYDEFKKLATVFYDDTPGLLIHPVWQEARAIFGSLLLKQEPKEDFVSYSFEFWECFDGYDRQLQDMSGAAQQTRTSASEQAKQYHTVVAGETMWKIASQYSMSLESLIALNPQIKNPNLIYPGDQLRIA